MIEFKRKFSLGNGQKINRKNWQNIKALSLKPCTNILGVPEIEAHKAAHGEYFCLYNLVKEKEGYIFREQYAGTGINGHHETYRKAVWNACMGSFRVYLEEEVGENQPDKRIQLNNQLSLFSDAQ